MPQTTPERAARWPGMDSEAIEFLKKKGFILTKDWYWRKPHIGHTITPKENDAIIYLIQEWDFGGIATA